METRPAPGTWDPEATAAFWINRASRALLRHFDARLRVFGFAMSHLPVLRALADGRPRSQAQLAQLARVEQPTMAETLARMARDGVIERAPSPSDKRRVLITLTRRARARLPKARAALVAGEREAMAGLSHGEQAQLRQLLARVVGNLDAAAGASADRPATRKELR